jgi:hypothetical protein
LSGTTDLRERAKRWLARRSAIRWIVGLGTLLTATSLGSGLAVDDYLHAITLLKIPWPGTGRGPLDLFRFVSGDPATARALQDIGQYPWTADTTMRFGFFRPLSAATHVLDYALWPRTPWMMHAQNMAWFALALLGAAAVYRRFLGPTWVAGLALLLYAVDDTHGATVVWIANRNALVALSLGLPVLVLHDSWRRGIRPSGRWLAPLLLGVALLAGESALAIVAYLAAYELHVDRGSWRARTLALVPYAAVLAAWRAAYAWLGYGVRGSGTYFDPASSPLEFLAALPRRLPFLLLGELGVPRSDLGITYEYLPGHVLPVMIGFAVVVLGILAVAFARLWRQDPVARFFATGLLLASVPVCAAFAGDRLLLFVGVGAMGLVAQLVGSAASRLERGAARLFVVLHLFLAPPLLLLRSALVDYQRPIDTACATIPRTPDVEGKTVVLVNPPNDLFYVYVPAVRAVRGEPRPARLRGLSNVIMGAEVERVDDRTLRIAPDGGFLQRELERMLRDDRHPLLEGAVVSLPGMTVTITKTTPERHPAEALFRFDVPLEDSSLVWMCWTKDGYAPWKPPPVGATVRLPAHDFPQFVRDVEDRLSAG